MTDKPKEKVIDKLQKWWTLAEGAHQPWLVQARQDLDFYIGGDRQWDANDLSILRAEKRPALTYNMLFSLVNLVSGYQRQNRQDITIYNRKGGTKEIANILSELIKHIHDGSYGDWETSLMFLMGIITGKGWLGLNVDYDDEVTTGEIVIENLSPFRIYPDPFSTKYDMRDGQFIFKIAWLPKDRLNLAFPEKKNEFEGLVVNEKDKEPLPFTEGDKYKDWPVEGSSTEEIDKFRYRVKECWWKDFEEQKFLVGIESGVVKQVDFPKAKIDAILRQYPTMRIVKRVRPVLNLTTYVGNVEIQNIRDPLNGVTQFPIIPFFSYWVENHHWGVITQLKDPQREINKRISQALHHLNQTANSGYTADENATADWDALENNISKPGYIKKLKPGARFERDTPAPLSEGHIKLAETGKGAVREISGVNPDLAGLPEDKNVSGILMAQRRSQGLITIESVFDNMRMSKQILGTRLIEMIQKTDVYTKQEILTMVIDGDVKEFPVNMQAKQNAVGEIKNDLTIGKYKISVSESKTSPTARTRDFAMLIEAVRAGLPIPPEVLLKASDLPYKEDIMQAMGAGAPAPGGAPGGAPPPAPKPRPAPAGAPR